jgi:hypothetical protein
MADAKSGKIPDPLGKRALYGTPPGVPKSRPASPADGRSTGALPVGKRALYSEMPSETGSVRDVADNPLTERGSFTVRCQRCRQVSHVGLLDMLIFQFPIGVWLPRGRFDHKMTCPSCRKRSWCSVTLRRD